MNAPEGLYYTKEHEWIRIEGEIGTVGISDHAQEALGDITFVELPKVTIETKQFGNLATIESVKAASDIFAPMSGKVLEVNTKLENNPALVNQSCYGEGWIAKIRIKDMSEKKNLMDATAYRTFIERLAH